MNSQGNSFSTMFDVLLKEGKRRVILLASILSIVALTALALGIILPKKYDASTLLSVETGASAKFVDGKKEGGPELGPITLQVTEGKKVLRELLLFGEWVKPPPAKQPDPQEEAQLLSKLRSRMKIDTSKEGIVRISFSDNDPDRAYKVANRLAEIYIREADEGQQRDARDALKFLEDQVKEYGEKLASYQQQVLAHHQGDPNAAALGIAKVIDAADAGTAPAAPQYRPQGKLSPEELTALRMEKATLEAQLARKSAAALPDPQAEIAAKARVAQLQSDLDRLRAAYTEEHPDVKRVKRELGTAKEELTSVEAARKARENDARNAEALDEEVRAATRARLEAIDKKLAAAGASVVPFQRNVTPQAAAAAKASAATPDPELKGIGQDTTLSELVRRYEATLNVYQDLLKRREAARVALEVVTQHHGFTIRVAEPAERPTAATGLRLSHFCLVGLLLATLIPLGVLFAIVRFDKRVRSPVQIEILARVPLLVSITPPPPMAAQSAMERHRTRVAMGMVAGVFVIYIAAFIIKMRA